ncbi:hypothetical protein [Moellerella wisconsensis]|uniref:Uncharacterized protein n=1 Tax=Moellerella wisconsensis ATCC 35017 TaxID=1354267 RepID=A0A0N0Z9E5_9GAMM|nr:hypothetical protein [Moellerella wisconsensis]KPD02206.1 hypothetical protein M992_2400 [Moellerella wisconsensis ATCC 35017]VFS54056.1 Uncharacterised protein [Moellerella wisconsensis]
MKRELEEADKTGADKTVIYDKYGKISKRNRDKAIAEIESGGSFDAIGAWADLNGGVEVADSLKWIALFDDLSSEDRSQLVNFVKVENAESAKAIYDSLSVTAKVALYTKDAADNMGVGGAIPSSGVSVVGIKGSGNKGNKQPYQSNQGAVGNMSEFLKQPGLGSQAKTNSQKTSKVYQGQSVYQASNDVGQNIKKGDQFYLDGQHKNHLEVFDKRGNFKAVLNLDGSVNQAKTDAAMGRKLK